jgi:hypothetical protein
VVWVRAALVAAIVHDRRVVEHDEEEDKHAQREHAVHRGRARELVLLVEHLLHARHLRGHLQEWVGEWVKAG